MQSEGALYLCAVGLWPCRPSLQVLCRIPARGSTEPMQTRQLSYFPELQIFWAGSCPLDTSRFGKHSCVSVPEQFQDILPRWPVHKLLCQGSSYHSACFPLHISRSPEAFTSPQQRNEQIGKKPLSCHRWREDVLFWQTLWWVITTNVICLRYLRERS